MKKISCVLLTVFFIHNTCYSLNQDETEYHCPSVNDIQYKYGQFNAETSYNGITMLWFSLNTFEEASKPVIKFQFTNGVNDCIGGTCKIYCVYEVGTTQKNMLKMLVSRQDYRFVQPINGPWQNKECYSNEPESCIFSVTKHHW